MIIQIIGLPGSGKTALAKRLADRINAIHLNGDETRATVNKDLGFSIESRMEQARRLGELARLISKQGHHVVVDFVCPTKLTRNSFGTPDMLVFMDTIESGRFKDTNDMFERPEYADIRFNTHDMDPDQKAKYIIATRKDLHDWYEPTTLMLGRYQPWHEGHHALYDEAGKRTDQVMVGVRSTHKTSPKDPLSFDQVKVFIDQDEHMQSAMVIKMPNITNIVYGRDVGYKIEQIKFDDSIESISATQKRKDLGI